MSNLSNEDLIVNNNEEKRNTVIRVVHNRENPFVQLNKEALWDKNLSLKAVGLWARCMSRPNDWKFSMKEFVGKCKEGRRSIDAAMDELIAAGYVYKIEHSEKGKDGKFTSFGVEYIFFEFPATEEEKAYQLSIFKKSFQYCGFGNCRFGDRRNDHLLIKNNTKKEKTKKEREGENPPQSPALSFSFEEKKIKKEKINKTPSSSVEEKKIEREKHVELSKSEHEKLIKDYGEEITIQCYKRLSEWKQDTPKSKWKKNDYRSILRWVIDSIKEEKLKKSKIVSEIETPEENKILAKNIAENFNPVRCPQKDMRIDVLNKHVEIVFLKGQRPPICLTYEEKGFKEQFENLMRKCGLL